MPSAGRAAGGQERPLRSSGPAEDRDIQAVRDTIAALGQPLFLRPIGAPRAPTAVIARLKHGPAVVDVDPGDSIQMAMTLVDGRGVGDRSGGALADRIRGGGISIFPPAEGVRVPVGGEADVLQLFVGRPYAEAALQAPFGCPPIAGLLDEAMQALILRVLVGSSRQAPDDALLVEESLLALMVRAAWHGRSRRTTAARDAMSKGGIAPAALRRVEAMIAAALAEARSPTLIAMADAAGLGISHFIRAFRQQTGKTPHRYLVYRRLERAVPLLRDGSVPVGEIADRMGFSSPSHFVAGFRAVMGVTPGAVRDALGRRGVEPAAVS